MDRPRAGPGGKYDRHALGKLVEYGDDLVWNVTDPHRGHNQAVSSLALRFNECAVVAKGDGRNTDSHSPAEAGLDGQRTAAHQNGNMDATFYHVADRPVLG